MGIYETFSKRQKKKEKAGNEDVYQYDSLPEPFRIQVIHIWLTSIGKYTGSGWSSYIHNEYWKQIHDKSARELGVFTLGDSTEDFASQCQEYLLKADTAGALDIVELSFRVIEDMGRKLSSTNKEVWHITQSADDAIKELNYRFQEHGIGYRFVEGELIRIDSQYVHEEIVKPAISLLNELSFRGAAQEFLNAHEHYRKSRYKEAVAEALKAFESTMKSICDTRKWPYPKNATAVPLIKILLDNGLIPKDLESHFGGLRTAMESGLPTISNRTSRHGQGLEPKEIPSHYAAYAFHLAASNIVFLVEAHKNMK